MMVSGSAPSGNRGIGRSAGVCATADKAVIRKRASRNKIEYGAKVQAVATQPSKVYDALAKVLGWNL